MFEHSVKVPRHYKIAANIFKKVSTEGGSVKTLLYDDKLRHFRTNVLYALITETIKHAADLDKVFECSSLLKHEARLDPWLAKVLTTELLFGKKALPGKSKPEQTIIAYKEQFETFLKENPSDLKTEVVRRPRYVRINTNLLTTSDAIGAFQDEGYRFIRCTSGSYDDYLKQIQALTEYDFTQDYHVKTVFVFSAGTRLHEHELYMESKIILQDKATAMAVHLLSPPSGSVALDMCAAPGMKTTQLAAFLRNEGKIYAVERNEKRYQTLCEFVARTGSKCVETLHKDALEIKRGDLDDVEYILLDPSCSGSGMELCVHNYIEETRLAKLTSLQEKFLKHAMNAFPNAKKIVYSTCSLFPEENERVITNVVKTSRAKWRVQDVKELLKGQWNNFGSGMYGSIGARCMYARPETDFTTGFFLAVLERDQKDLEKSLHSATKKDEVAAEYDGELTNEYPEVCEKSAKKRKNRDRNLERELVEENIITEQEIVTRKKRNKKIKEHDKSMSVDIEETIIEPNGNDVELQNDADITKDSDKGKRKKKKKKHQVTEVTDAESKETPNVEEDSRKKKAKKHEPEITVESTNKEHGSKGKKKLKEFQVNVETEMALVTEVEDGVPTKKKKKKSKENS